jgi:hypothetical protein
VNAEAELLTPVPTPVPRQALAGPAWLGFSSPSSRISLGARAAGPEGDLPRHYTLDGIYPSKYYGSVVEVVITGEFRDWYDALDASDQESVRRVVNLLEHRGVRLGEPHSSAIIGSRHALRELRIQSRGRPIRVFHAFDPQRQAVLLIAGNKAGDDRFYEVFVPRAERIWEEYLAETGQKRGGSP